MASSTLICTEKNYIYDPSLLLIMATVTTFLAKSPHRITSLVAKRF